MDNTCAVYQQYYNNPQNKDKYMNIYAYGMPACGRLKLQGQYYQGVDYRTKEHYQVYKDCGFNLAFPVVTGNYANETWEDSKAKHVMNLCEQIDVKKVIILDERLRLLSLQKESLIGEGDIFTQDGKRAVMKKFKDEAALDAYVKERMSAYVNEPTFYGVQLLDEPRIVVLKALGEVYRSIKRVYPQTFVQVNLNPIFFRFSDVDFLHDYDYDDSLDFIGRYKAYVYEFLDRTGADYILTDRYPYHTGDGNDVYPYYFLNFQILSDIAAERNLRLQFVVQSYGGFINGGRAYRMPNAAEMEMQIHTCLGFGIQEFAYYTYWASALHEIRGEYRLSDESIVSAQGVPTQTYPVVQRLNAMIQKLAPVIMNFKHVSDTYAAVSPMRSKPLHLQFTRRGKLKMAEKFRVSHELGFVSEMYDEEKGQYLYVMQNITSSLHCPDIGKQSLSIIFKGDVNKVDIFDGNEWHTEDLPDDKVFHTQLESGSAVYVMPYRA